MLSKKLRQVNSLEDTPHPFFDLPEPEPLFDVATLPLYDDENNAPIQHKNIPEVTLRNPQKAKIIQRPVYKDAGHKLLSPLFFRKKANERKESYLKEVPVTVLDDNLPNVDLTGWKATDEALSYIDDKCTGIDLKGCSSITDDGLKELGRLSLETLRLDGCCRVSANGFITLIKGQKNLKEISVAKCNGVDDKVIACAVGGGLKKLEILNISECVNISNKCLEHIVRCKSLKALIMKGCHSISEEGFQYITLHGSLERLILHDCLQLDAQSFLNEKKPIAKLTEVDISSCRLDDSLLNFLVDYAPAIRTFTLDSRIEGRKTAEFDNEQLRAITPLGLRCIGRLKNLCSLSLVGIEVVNDYAIGAFGNEAFEELNLVDCSKVTDSGILSISQKSPNLRRIQLGGLYGISDDSFRHLARNCPRLLDLNVTGRDVSRGVAVGYPRKITDIGLKCLAKGCKRLKKLNVNGILRVTDIGVIALAKGCPTLNSLNIGGCVRVGNASMIALSENCQKLRELDCSRCPNISDGGVMRLKVCKLMESFSVFKCPKVSDASLSNVVRFWPKLEKFNCGVCLEPGDDTLMSLAARCHFLKVLKMGESSGVTDKGVNYLRSLMLLQQVSFAQCDFVSESALHSLSLHLPLCKIQEAGSQMVLTSCAGGLRFQRRAQYWSDRYKYHVAALKIQKIFRGLRSKKIMAKLFRIRDEQRARQARIQKRRAVALLQRVGRGFLGRCIARHIRENIAASLIQFWWHSRIIRFNHLRRLERIKMQKWEYENAMKIQAITRGYQAKVFVAAKREQIRIERKQYDGAVRIQCLIRSRLAKLAVEQRKEEILLEQRQNEAAIKIQCMLRSHIARNIVGRKKKENAIVKIQSMARRRSAHIIITRKRWEQQAAMRIQALFRGVLGRKLALKRKEELEVLMEQTNAAMKIQSVFRRKSHLKKVELEMISRISEVNETEEDSTHPSYSIEQSCCVEWSSENPEAQNNNNNSSTISGLTSSSMPITTASNTSNLNGSDTTTTNDKSDERKTIMHSAAQEALSALSQSHLLDTLPQFSIENFVFELVDGIISNILSDDSRNLNEEKPPTTTTKLRRKRTKPTMNTDDSDYDSDENVTEYYDDSDSEVMDETQYLVLIKQQKADAEAKRLLAEELERQRNIELEKMKLEDNLVKLKEERLLKHQQEQQQQQQQHQQQQEPNSYSQETIGIPISSSDNSQIPPSIPQTSIVPPQIPSKHELDSVFTIEKPEISEEIESNLGSSHHQFQASHPLLAAPAKLLSDNNDPEGSDNAENGKLEVSVPPSAITPVIKAHTAEPTATPIDNANEELPSSPSKRRFRRMSAMAISGIKSLWNRKKSTVGTEDGLIKPKFSSEGGGVNSNSSEIENSPTSSPTRRRRRRMSLDAVTTSAKTHIRRASMAIGSLAANTRRLSSVVLKVKDIREAKKAELARARQSVLAHQRNTITQGGLMDLMFTYGLDESARFHDSQVALSRAGEPFYFEVGQDLSPLKLGTPIQLWAKVALKGTRAITTLSYRKKPKYKKFANEYADEQALKAQDTTICRLELPANEFKNKHPSMLSWQILMGTTHKTATVIDVKMAANSTEQAAMQAEGFEFILNFESMGLLAHSLMVKRKLERNNSVVSIPGSVGDGKELEAIHAIPEGMRSGDMKRYLDFLMLDYENVCKMVDVFVECIPDHFGLVEDMPRHQKLARMVNIHVPVVHMLEAMNADSSVLSRLLVKFLAKRIKKNETIQLPDFIRTMSAISLLGRSEIELTLFSMFDKTQTSRLTPDDLKVLIDVISLSSPFPMEEHRIMVIVKPLLDVHGELPPKGFQRVCRQFPSLVFLVESLQKSVQNAFMGKKFWAKKNKVFSKARRQISAEHAAKQSMDPGQIAATRYRLIDEMEMKLKINMSHICNHVVLDTSRDRISEGVRGIFFLDNTSCTNWAKKTGQPVVDPGVVCVFETYQKYFKKQLRNACRGLADGFNKMYEDFFIITATAPTRDNGFINSLGQLNRMKIREHYDNEFAAL